MSGTVQDVFAVIQQAAPGALPAVLDDVDPEDHQLHSRSTNKDICPHAQRYSPFRTRPPGTYTALYRTCGDEIPGEWATTQAMYSGIKYLRKVPGTSKNEPGLNACGRVSCSYNTAIYWCNDVSACIRGGRRGRYSGQDNHFADNVEILNRITPK